MKNKLLLIALASICINNMTLNGNDVAAIDPNNASGGISLSRSSSHQSSDNEQKQPEDPVLFRAYRPLLTQAQGKHCSLRTLAKPMSQKSPQNSEQLRASYFQGITDFNNLQKKLSKNNKKIRQLNETVDILKENNNNLQSLHESLSAVHVNSTIKIKDLEKQIPTLKQKLLFGGVCAAAGTALGIFLCKTDIKSYAPSIRSSFGNFFSSFKGSSVNA